MRKPILATSMFLLLLPILRFLLDLQLARFDLQERNYTRLISKRRGFTKEECVDDPQLPEYPDIVINRQASLALANLALGTYLNNESFIDELHVSIDEYLANQTAELKKLTAYQVDLYRQTIREIHELSQKLDDSHAIVIANGRWVTNKLIAFTDLFPDNIHSKILAATLLLFPF